MYQEIRLESKKNKVYRISDNGKNYILKKFSNITNLDKEIEVLQILDGQDLLVPKILEINDSSLILEDLGEATLLSYYEKLEKENEEDYLFIIKGILFWISNFHRVTKSFYGSECILSDVNFRNFIVKENNIYGIDFEEVTFGKRETDIGKLLAFGLMYKPEMTVWKKRFMESFIKELVLCSDYDITKVILEKEIELARIQERRK